MTGADAEAQRLRDLITHLYGLRAADAKTLRTAVRETYAAALKVKAEGQPDTDGRGTASRPA